MALTAVILDDERRGRELLAKLLELYCPDVQIKAMTATLDEAQQAVTTHTPDMLFLDMRIGNEFGFDLLPSLGPNPPHIIVTTAYEEYAIKALRAQATDYLLKPIVSDELKAAVQKVREKKNGIDEAATKIEMPTAPAGEKKISIPTSEGLLFIKVGNIIRCEASGTYTELYTKEGKILTSINLGEFEKLLPEAWGFLRIHHSSLINMAEVNMYMKNDGGYVVMSDKSQISISQRKKPHFLQMMKVYFS
jgi:two-component system, LytTR family, response regulator